MGARGRGAVPQLRVVEGGPTRGRRAPSWQARRLSRVERIIRFVESLPITKGHLRGRKMELLRQQREFIERVYGRTDGDGHRLTRLAVLSMPRGNGKTGLLAALTLCHLCGPEAIERGELYSAAIDRGQASILFNEMRAIVLAVPELAARVNVIKHFKQLEVTSGPGMGSTYESLSNDGRRGMGLAPSFWCFDELAQVRDRELLDNLITGMGKQPEALGVVISTQSAEDDHPLSEIIDDGLAGLDPTVYVQLHTAPDDADPFSPAVWRAANPALRVFLSEKDMAAQAEAARRVPSSLASFRNLRLNQRVHADERLIARDEWLACQGEPTGPEALAGRACWGGLDLSSTTDLTALTLVFEPAARGEPMPVKAWFWIPAGTIAEMERSDHKTYRLWHDQGLIETTPGRAIDKRAVALRLGEIAARYKVQAIGFDDWRFADLEKILNDEGIVLPLRKMRQGYKTMGPCVDALEAAVLDRKIRHDGNQVLTMCIANAVATTDPTGSRKLDKSRSRARIDGAVCLSMALGLRATEAAPPAESAFQMIILGGKR